MFHSRFSISWTKHCANSRGGAIAELALCLPLLLLLSLGAVEISRQIQLTQVAAALSKEAADRAYRRCSDLFGAAALNCIEDVRGAINGFADQLYPNSNNPNTSVIITIYPFNNAVLGPRNNPRDTSHVTRYQANNIDQVATVTGPNGFTLNNDQNIFRDKGQIVVAEVYVPYTSVIQSIVLIGSIFNLGGNPWIYDSSIV